MNETTITDRRKMTVERVDLSKVEWHVDEFDGGRVYMLVASAANTGVQFSAHFTGEQWTEFQKLIASPVTQEDEACDRGLPW